jgi:hypothetical protein
MRWRGVIVVMLILLQAIIAQYSHAQQLITTCGASKGKAYYLEPTHQGWVDDGISGGTLTFFRYPNGDYDLLFKDTVGARSAREDGGTVSKIFGDGSKLLTLGVTYAKTSVVEVYQLTLDVNGRGTLIWSNLKNRSGPIGVTRGMVMTSNCSR